MTQNTITDEYAPGSLYILYTNFGSDADIDALKHRLYDYNQLKLGEGQYISDWESGIVDDQITNISGSAQAMANVKAYTIETDDMMALYNISSFLTLQYIKKNQSKLQAPFVNGVIFNEYLTNHPQYEAFVGYVPLLYQCSTNLIFPTCAQIVRSSSNVRYSIDLTVFRYFCTPIRSIIS